MKKIRRGMIPISIIAVLLASLLAPAVAYADPITPTSFYGEVIVNETPADVGTLITGRIVDAVGSPGEGSIEITEPGEYGGDQPLDLKLSVKTDSSRDVGKEIEFYVKLPEWAEAQKAVPAAAATFDSEVHELGLTVTTSEEPTYALTMVAAPVEGGTATDVTGLSPYEEGAEVSIEAVLAEGYHFVNWTAPAGAFANASQAETTFTMPGEAATVTANFAVITYDLTVASTAGGSVTTPGEPGPFTYDAGAVVNLLAEPDTDYEFLNWTGDVGTIADVNAASTTITMNGNYTIQANFGEIGVTYNLTVASTDGGSVTTPGEGVQGPYDSGAEVPLLAEPEEGYQFLNWTGEVGTIADVNAASTTITMNADYAITANFALIGITYDLTVSSTAGGSVTDPGEGTFIRNPGAVVDLVAVPDAGYEFLNWTGDVSTVADVNAASTTITMNGNYSITANFMASLGDLIDETPADGTLELGAGTYSGDVTIDKSLTITGTAGTIISGGITIAELTGSEVTIENLTITDYTDFGIRIVKVRDVDNFIIRNNTILGVEGSVVGIQVDEVVTGGNLTIMENAISGNQVGVKLLEAVADGGIQFNDITGNTIGLEQLAEVIGAYAGLNWWGDISGPGEENQNPGGIGDNVTGNIGYYPWLTRDFQTVLDDNIAYFGYPMVELNTGWNIISTPIALDPLVEWVDSDNISRTGVDTWGDYVALGDGLSTDNTSPVYSFDAENQAWVGLTSDDTLDPCDAIYVRMASDDIAPILYSPDVSVPSKELYSGWNLVSLAWLPTSMDEVYGLPANEALVTVEEVSGGLTGYKLVVSPGVNDYEQSWIHIAGQTIELWTDPNVWPPPDGNMVITSGYWVFMLNDGTLAGFAFTPVSLPPMP